MEPVFGKPLITQREMERRVKELGGEISLDYRGKDLLVVGVLKGAFAFYADLVKAIRIPIRVDFLIVSSQPGRTQREKVKMVSKPTEDIAGQDVLLVEDIVDSGMTLSFLKKRLRARRPRSLRVCTLFDKRKRRAVRVAIDYVGFEIPNQYVVGYGLDYQNQYRNLPYIAVLENVREAEELFYWQEE